MVDDERTPRMLSSYGRVYTLKPFDLIQPINARTGSLLFAIVTNLFRELVYEEQTADSDSQLKICCALSSLGFDLTTSQSAENILRHQSEAKCKHSTFIRNPHRGIQGHLRLNPRHLAYATEMGCYRESQVFG